MSEMFDMYDAQYDSDDVDYDEDGVPFITEPLDEDSDDEDNE
jgi:hypothetical protein